MRKQAGWLAVVLFSVLLSGDIWAAADIKVGKWEITTKMEIPGMPAQMSSRTYTHCLTEENMVPQQEEPGKECKMVNSQVNGNTIIWQMTCQTPEGPSVLDGTVTYNGDSMTGVIKIRQVGINMTQRMSGRWLGPCD